MAFPIQELAVPGTGKVGAENEFQIALSLSIADEKPSARTNMYLPLLMLQNKWEVAVLQESIV